MECVLLSQVLGSKHGAELNIQLWLDSTPDEGGYYLAIRLNPEKNKVILNIHASLGEHVAPAQLLPLDRYTPADQEGDEELILGELWKARTRGEKP